MFLLWLLGLLSEGVDSSTVSDLIFCPSMGRYGNQLDHYLSMIHFSRVVDRRLILPPLIVYAGSEIQLVPFGSVFNLERLAELINIASPAEYDMTQIDAIFCLERWMTPDSPFKCQNCEDKQIGCALNGSPSVPFWAQLNVTFVESFALDRYGQGVRMSHTDRSFWSSIENDIVALPGSILPFPAPQSFNHIHSYLHFSGNIKSAADSIVKEIGGRFLSIHLRNGPDWTRACALIEKQKVKSLMSSPQCNTPLLKLELFHCAQSKSLILQTLSNLFPLYQRVYISTDAESYSTSIAEIGFQIFTIKEIQGRSGLKVDPILVPLVDLAVHGQSDLFVANCVSSFSSFAVRQRSVSGRATIFWGVNQTESHTEL